MDTGIYRCRVCGRVWDICGDIVDSRYCNCGYDITMVNFHQNLDKYFCYCPEGVVYVVGEEKS